MKTLITIVAIGVVVCVVSSAAVAQPYLKIWHDSDYTIDEIDCPGPSVLDTLFVVAHNFNCWLVGVEYQLTIPASMIVVGYQDTAVKIGSEVTGVAMAWSVPQSAFGPMLIQSIIVFHTCSDCSTPNQVIAVDVNSKNGHLRAVRWPDMAYVNAFGSTSYLCPADPFECRVEPNTIDYGNVEVGSTSDRSFKIYNEGTMPLVGSVSESCSHYSIVSGGGSYGIVPGDSLEVTTRFVPTAVGTHLCTVETGHAVCEDVSLTGVGVPPPECAVTPETIDFGTVFVGSYAETTFTIKNSGGGTLLGEVTEACPHYSIVSGVGLFALSGTDSVEVGVRFEPTVPGTHACPIDLGPGLCDPVSCTGVGEMPPDCDVFPTDLAFGSQQINTAQDQSFEVTNTGGGLLTGTVSEAVPHYSIVAGGGPFSLAGGDTLLVMVRYEPTSIGPHIGTIAMGNVSCDSVSCTGIGVDNPVCLVDPTNLDFGVVDVGSTSDLVFKIKNTGGGTLGGTVSETCPEFSLVSGSGAFSLAGAESVLVTVRYAPPDTGVHNCTIALGQALCGDVSAFGSSSADPYIVSVLDVGNDQGRNVRINFLRSAFDMSGSPTPILQYEAFRRIDVLPTMLSEPAATLETSVDNRVKRALDSGMRSSGAIMAAGWDFVGWVPAHVEDEYNMIAPTLADSTITHGMHWSVFFVRAATSDPGTFFDSPPDSGYSLDGMVPNPPQSFTAVLNPEGGVELSWGASTDPDLDHYNLYRSDGASIAATAATVLHSVAGTWTLVHSTPDTHWLDPVSDGWRYSYQLTAVDDAGNESDATGSGGVTGVGDTATPLAFGLHQNVPNPFNPNTTIAYDVGAGGGRVAIRVYDVDGRLVRTLVEGTQGEGRQTVTWDGTDAGGNRVASGVYFYRMSAPGFERTRKMVLLQ